MTERAWLEIDQSKISNNIQALKEHVKPCKLLAVLKADAYGVSLDRLLKIAVDAGVDCLGVAELDAAVRAKSTGLPVHLLGALLPSEVEGVVRNQIIAPIGDLETAEALQKTAKDLKIKAIGQIKLDTGMGRLGIPLVDAQEFIKYISKFSDIEIIGMYSHFPHAYADQVYSEEQVSSFIKVYDLLKTLGHNLEYLHIANSDGIQNIPAAVRAPFNMVRAGINLYGYYDEQGQRAVKLESALALKTRVIQLRELPSGSFIGYGKTYRLNRSQRIATLPIGYADGLPIAAGNRGRVRIKGIDCPIVGRVSMDYTTVVVDHVPEIKCGDEVECFGSEIPVAELAKLKGVSIYEILCSIGQRVKRVLI